MLKKVIIVQLFSMSLALVGCGDSNNSKEHMTEADIVNYLDKIDCDDVKQAVKNEEHAYLKDRIKGHCKDLERVKIEKSKPVSW